MSQEELTDEDAVATFSDRKVTADGRVRLPTEVLDEHGLREAVLDVRLAQGDRSVAIMDVETDSVGRFTIPARKRRLYDIKCGEYVSGAVEEVVRA